MRKVDAWLAAIVVLAALVVAIGMFRGYYQHPELLWRGDPSDRAPHFELGLSLALAARNLDPAWYWHQIEFAKLWPPVHGLVLSAVLLIGGLDVRLGVIPSLIGWTVTVAMTWVMARRLFQDQVVSVVAASVAVIYALASPSFRLLATDVMLECPGSALTALAVYLYMRTYTPTPNATTWRLLAVTLTLLFFEKYNYWGLTFIALTLTHVMSTHASQNRKEWAAFARTWWRDRRHIAGVIIRDPAVLASLAVLGFVFYAYWHGPGTLDVFGLQLGIYPPENPTTVAYAILFVRLTVAWFRHRQSLDAALGVPGQAILYWNLLPVAVSFLIPRRLTWFLWENGSASSIHPEHDPLSGLIEYAHGIGEGFTVAPWAAALAVLLASIALIQHRRFPPQCQAIFVLVIVCALLVILHPNHQARFLASWAFAIWICAGAGAGLVFQWATRRTDKRSVRAAVAVCAVAALAATTALTKPSWAVAAAVAHQTPGPSEFDLLPAFLPFIGGSSNIGFLPSSFGEYWFLLWNAEMQCRCRVITDSAGNLEGLSHDETVQRTLNMVRSTDADVIVGTFSPANKVSNDSLLEAMRTQNRFHLVASSAVPSRHGEMMVWRR